MIKQDNNLDNENNSSKKSIRTLITITLYIAFGFLWLFTSKSLVQLIVKSNLDKTLFLYWEGAFFIVISAAGLYLSISKLERYLYLSINRLRRSNENLRSAKERLHKQLEEINLKENALRISEERYRLASDGSQDGIWDLDLVKNELVISSRVENLVGLNKTVFNVKKKQWKEFIHPNDRDYLLNTLNDYLFGKIDVFNVECRLRRKKGDYLWISFRGKGIWDEYGNALRIAGSITDITERKLHEQRIYNLAYYDQITGLPNRSGFFEQLNKIIQNSYRNDKNFVVFFIDLDDFKAVNDTLGHDCGDVLMKEVSELLKDIFKDCFTARFGGDEFIVIKEINTEKDNISDISKNTVNSLGKAWTINNHEFYISVSIGVSIFPIHGTTPQDLIKNADLAMYTAKSNGKNTYAIFNPSMRNDLLEMFKWEKDLVKALENDEFKIYYQPQVSAMDETILGAEALIRWNHTERGLISPNEFIPIAEETGLIVNIGEKIIDKTIEQIKHWKDSNIKVVPISINLSPLQFQQQNLVQYIDNVLQNYNIDPSLVKFEITESTALKDINQTINTIKIFNSMGIEVALDDFGTGYSSLTYLKQLPISSLKIDKAFIRDINSDIREASIVLNIITLAHDLSIKVVAEGVETLEQYTILKDYGCDEIQGYYFGKPMPVSEFESFIKKNP